MEVVVQVFERGAWRRWEGVFEGEPTPEGVRDLLRRLGPRSRALLRHMPDEPCFALCGDMSWHIVRPR